MRRKIIDFAALCAGVLVGWGAGSYCVKAEGWHLDVVAGSHHFGLDSAAPADGWTEGTANFGFGLSTDGPWGGRVGCAGVFQNSYGDPTLYCLYAKDWAVTPETDFGSLHLGFGGGFAFGYDPDDLPGWDHDIVPSAGLHVRYDVFNNDGGVILGLTPMADDFSKGVLTLRLSTPVGGGQ